MATLTDSFTGLKPHIPNGRGERTTRVRGYLSNNAENTPYGAAVPIVRERVVNTLNITWANFLETLSQLAKKGEVTVQKDSNGRVTHVLLHDAFYNTPKLAPARETPTPTNGNFKHEVLKLRDGDRVEEVVKVLRPPVGGGAGLPVEVKRATLRVEDEYRSNIEDFKSSVLGLTGESVDPEKVERPFNLGYEFPITSDYQTLHDIAQRLDYENVLAGPLSKVVPEALRLIRALELALDALPERDRVRIQRYIRQGL